VGPPFVLRRSQFRSSFFFRTSYFKILINISSTFSFFFDQAEKPVMEKEDLMNRTEQFSLRIMKLVESLPPGKATAIIAGQLLRSATSIGANYRAARRAKSKRDFVNKLKIAEEETDESIYWLSLVQKSGTIDPMKLHDLVREANELLAIFVASIKTAKLNLERERRESTK
jgi:four helix bundle protein